MILSLFTAPSIRVPQLSVFKPSRSHMLHVWNIYLHLPKVVKYAILERVGMDVAQLACFCFPSLDPVRTCSTLSKHTAGFPHGHGVPGEEELHQLGVFLMLSFWPERRRKWYGWGMWREKCIIILNKSINMYIYFLCPISYTQNVYILNLEQSQHSRSCVRLLQFGHPETVYIVRYCFKILKLKWTIGSCLEDCNIIY